MKDTDWLASRLVSRRLMGVCSMGIMAVPNAIASTLLAMEFV